MKAVLNSHVSRPFHTNKWVLQLSNLGPKMFAIFVEDSPISPVPNYVFIQMTKPFIPILVVSSTDSAN